MSSLAGGANYICELVYVEGGRLHFSSARLTPSRDASVRQDQDRRIKGQLELGVSEEAHDVGGCHIIDMTWLAGGNCYLKINSQSVLFLFSTYNFCTT